MKRFDRVSGIKQQSGAHTTRSREGDLKRLMEELFERSEVFTKRSERKHSSFPGITANNLKYVTVGELSDWLQRQFHKLLTFRPTKE